MDFRQIDKNLQVEFSNKKINAEKIASSNIAKLKKNPVYLKLDELEREISFELSKCKSKNERYKNLKENLLTVRTEKIKILAKLNLKESDLKPKYECERCADTGIVSGKICGCFKKRRNEEIVKTFGFSVQKDISFEMFNTDICKNAKQIEILQKLSKKLKEWSEKYPNNSKNNIIISGKTGVGKTYLSSCLANEMMKKDLQVCFVSAFDMNDSFLKYHTSFDTNKSSWIEPFLDADVLFIDDLGTEPMLNNVTKNYLYLVLSEREQFNKPVIITTNLLPAEMMSRYDERIYSRLCNKRYSQLYLIEGDDLRVSK